MMRSRLMITAWILLYLALIIGPLALMLIGSVPAGRSYWVEFSIALGFLGLAQLCIQFFLIARFRKITSPYGIDAIMYYHRQVGTLAVLIIIAHPLVLILHEPAMLDLLNPFGGTWGSRTGVWSTIALVLLIMLSIFRRQLGLSYEVWRTTHTALAIIGIGLAIAHIALAGPYVSMEWKLLLWIAFAALGLAALGYSRLVKPLREKRQPYRIVGIRPEAERVWSLVLEPDGHAGMRFEPGQFAWLKLGSPFNIDEHPFSFSSSAEHTRQIEFGIKEVGDFTRALPDVQLSTPVYLDGPHGSFSIDRIPSAGYVFIAGGIGIVPILSMLRTMADRGDRRPALLIYATRSLANMAYRDALHALQSSLALNVICVLEQPPADWDGEAGIITRDLLKKHWPDDDGDPENAIERHVLICGPDAMIVAADHALRELGVPAARVHAERFELV